MDVAKSIVEQAVEAIVAVDREGRIEVWNPAAERLFGWSAEEARSGGLDLIIPERLREAHWAGFDRAVTSGTTKYGPKILTTRSMRRDGTTLYLDLSFGLLRDDAGAVVGAFAVARDITERYLAERAARAAKAGG